ncbi:hypothetical protein NC652_012946 [Populus alba x Populus x berolinensis]|nr:hypothetical protein NC652_012946 [Populus alba x Populus x berolinensis]
MGAGLRSPHVWRAYVIICGRGAAQVAIIINCHDIVDDSLIKVSIQRFGRSCPNSLTKSTFEVLFWEQILGMQMLYLQPSLILGFDSLPYNQSVF